MVIEQQQIHVFLNKIKALTTVIQNLQEAAINGH